MKKLDAKICEQCQNDFQPKRSRQTYCSNLCVNKSKKGSTFRLSQIAVEKIRIAHLGSKRSETSKEKMRKAKLGKTLSDEHRRKIGQSRSGEKSNWYKHGKTKDPAYKSFINNQWSRRKRLADGNHSYEDWETLKAQYNWTCPCCEKKEPEIKLTEDHIIPLSKGGSDNIENIQPLCLPCNLKKSVKIVRY